MTNASSPLHPRAAFKDTMGRLRTQSLFVEKKDPNYPAYFTVREEDFKDGDGNEYVSLRRLYVESQDPTEYRFAQRAFGSWRHWLRIRSMAWLQPHLTEWREELDARLRSLGSQWLQEALDGTSQVSVPAAKYFANGEYWDKPKKRGRPSKEEIEGTRKRLAKQEAELDEDFERTLGV